MTDEIAGRIGTESQTVWPDDTVRGFIEATVTMFAFGEIMQIADMLSPEPEHSFVSQQDNRDGDEEESEMIDFIVDTLMKRLLWERELYEKNRTEVE